MKYPYVYVLYIYVYIIAIYPFQNHHTFFGVLPHGHDDPTTLYDSATDPRYVVARPNLSHPVKRRKQQRHEIHCIGFEKNMRDPQVTKGFNTDLVFLNWMVSFMENPTKMDDLGVAPF